MRAAGHGSATRRAGGGIAVAALGAVLLRRVRGEDPPAGSVSAPVDDGRPRSRPGELRPASSGGATAVEDGVTAVAIVGTSGPHEGRFVCANPAFARMLGYAPDELAGALIHGLTHPDDRDRIHGAIATLREAGHVEIDKRFLHRSGAAVPALVIATPLPAIEPHVSELAVAHVINRTDHDRAARELREANERSETILASMGEGYCLTVGREIVAVNRAICEMTGFAESELVGSSMPFPFWTPEGHSEAFAQCERVLHAGGGVFELELRRRDGGRFVAEITARPASGEDGTEIGFVNTVRDVTGSKQREREQAALGVVARMVAQNADPPAVFAQLTRQLLTLFECRAASLDRFDHPGRGVETLHMRTKDGGELSGSRAPIDGPGVAAAVSRSGGVVRLTGASHVDLAPVDANVPSAPRSLSVAEAIAAPVRIAGELWGTVTLYFAEPTAGPDTEPRLVRFAELASLAISNALSWAALTRQAATDPLTGLANHRVFQKRLREEIARSRRRGRSLSLVILDLDHFKRINDTHGHQVGDRVLTELGGRLSAYARGDELVARIGGEEFAWLMPETEAEEALSATDRMRRIIEAEPFGEVGSLTASFGICTDGGGDGGDELVRRADRALYRAKAAGRNTISVYAAERDHAPDTEEELTDRVETMASVRALARAIDSRDPVAGRHSERVAALAELVALELGWPTTRARSLFASGLLHDVGKIGIPDDVLLKPGPLDEEERAQLEQHPILGAKIAAEVLAFEQVAWIRGHHERWDGSGYPDRLAGTRIPDGAAILGVCDAYDVMTEQQAYVTRRSGADAVAECLRCAGTQFSPAVVAALTRVTTDYASAASAAVSQSASTASR